MRSFFTIIYQMLEMKTNNERQIPSQNFNLIKKDKKRCQMPFNLQRHTYKQLIVYQKKGHWSQKQKLKYAVFLEYYKQRFQIKAKRRFNNIFDIMATFIKTRNPHQCRSHHQKMQKQKFQIDSIIVNTASKYHPRVYQQFKQRYVDQIQALNLDESQNFQNFKQRIEKIEERKAIQRQIVQNNKRVLRSTRGNQSKQQRSFRRLMKNKQRMDQLRTRQDSVQNRAEQKKADQPMKIQQPEDLNIDDFKGPKLQISQMPTVTSTNSLNPIFHRELEQIKHHENRNQLRIFEKIQDLETRKKQLLDLAYYHYNQYMKHVNDANNIQFQIMKENSIRGALRNF